MKEEKGMYEMNEKELEQVSGGSSVTIPKRYRCSVCGRTATQYYDEGTDPPTAILCISCQSAGRGKSKMYPA